MSLLSKQNKILKLSDICTHEVAIFTHKFCNKKLPITFSKYFCKTDTVHRLRTRQNLACEFAIPRYNTSRLQRSIKYGGIKIWNSISSETKNSSFKVILKKYKQCLLALYQRLLSCNKIPKFTQLVYFFLVLPFLHLNQYTLPKNL